jgi:hypothetical protein
MDKPGELQALLSVLDTYERDIGLFEAHRAVIEWLREIVALLRYQQPQRNAVKKETLRREIARLRAKVNGLKTRQTKPRERFRTVHELTNTLNAIQHTLEY